MPLFKNSENSDPNGKPPAKKSKLFSGNKTWFVFAIVAAIGGAGLLFAILSSMLATTTYYVLNTSVPARSQITPDMLTEVSTSIGTQPRNALGLADVSVEDVYAKVELNAGDVLSGSNTGDFIPLHQGIPDDYVVASFVADPNNAVGGKLVTGNYVDVIATDEESGGSKSVLRHVILTDVTASASDFEESEDVTDETDEQDQLREGLPYLYTVALNEKDAVKLASVREAKLFVVLSSKESDENFKDKDVKISLNEIYGEGLVTDSGKGTDPLLGQGDEEDEESGDINKDEKSEEKSDEKADESNPDENSDEENADDADNADEPVDETK